MKRLNPNKDKKKGDKNFVVTNFEEEEKHEFLKSKHNFLTDIQNIETQNYNNFKSNSTKKIIIINKEKMNRLGPSLSENQLKAIEGNRRFLSSRAFKFLSYKEKKADHVISTFPYKKVVTLNKKIKDKFERINLNSHDNSFIKKDYRPLTEGIEKDAEFMNMGTGHSANVNLNNSFQEEVAPFVDTGVGSGNDKRERDNNKHAVPIIASSIFITEDKFKNENK